MKTVVGIVRLCLRFIVKAKVVVFYCFKIEPITENKITVFVNTYFYCVLK